MKDGDGDVVCEDNSFKIDFSYYKKLIDAGLNRTFVASRVAQSSATEVPSLSNEHHNRPDLCHTELFNCNVAPSQETHEV